jgi:tricorn protease
MILSAIVGLAFASQTPNLRRGIFYSPAISRDHIVFARGEQLWCVDKAGGEARPTGAWANINALPQFSPDGRTVALLSRFVGGYELGTVPIEGGTSHRVTYSPRNGK